MPPTTILEQELSEVRSFHPVAAGEDSPRAYFLAHSGQHGVHAAGFDVSGRHLKQALRSTVASVQAGRVPRWFCRCTRGPISRTPPNRRLIRATSTPFISYCPDHRQKGIGQGFSSRRLPLLLVDDGLAGGGAITSRRERIPLGLVHRRGRSQVSSHDPLGGYIDKSNTIGKIIPEHHYQDHSAQGDVVRHENRCQPLIGPPAGKKFGEDLLQPGE